VWSVIPAVLVIVWLLGVLAGEVTVHPDPYTFDQVLDRVWKHGVLACVVSSWRTDWDRALLWWGWIGAFIGLWAWMLFAKSRVWRLACCWAMLACAVWPVVVHPLVLAMSLALLQAVFSTTDGESYQDGVLQMGTLAPWIMLAAICLAMAWVEPADTSVCRKCGCSLAGLRGGVCPECGAAVMSRSEVKRSRTS